MSPTLGVVVAGARGRLGSLVVEAIRATSDLRVAATLARGDDADGILRGSGADVLVDLTVAEASRVIVPLAAAAGISPVVGTSGLGADDERRFAEACQAAGVGGLLVPNFSLGAVLQMEACAAAAPWLACTAIHEIHHPAKRDAPSGTSRATAARIGAAGGTSPPITSERRVGAVAEQRVEFCGVGERLVLLHEVVDRQAYLPGVLLAIRRVRQLGRFARGLDAILDWPDRRSRGGARL